MDKIDGADNIFSNDIVGMEDHDDWEDLLQVGNEIDTSDVTSADSSAENISYDNSSPYNEQIEPPKKKRKLNDRNNDVSQSINWRILPVQGSKIINSQGIIVNDQLRLNIQCPNFTFSDDANAWLHFKGNNFQVTTHLEVLDPQFLNLPLFIAADYNVPVDSFAIEISAMSSFTNTIDHSLLVQMAPSRKGKSAVPHLPIQPGASVAHTRIKFEIATKKKAGTGPSEYFHLVVSLIAMNKELNMATTVLAYVSDPMTVVGTTPGRYGKSKKSEPIEDKSVVSTFNDTNAHVLQSPESNLSPSDNTGSEGWKTNHTAVYTNNKVGINTSEPNEALTVQGNVFVTGNIYQPSDQRLKTNFKRVSDKEMLQHIEDIPIYDYEWKEDSFQNQKKQARGVIAQEVQKVIPGAVVKIGRTKFGNQIVEETLAVDEKTLLMENMGATRALGKKMRAMSLWQKIIIAIIALGALAGLVIGAVMFWPAPHVDNFQFPIYVIGYWKNEERSSVATTIFFTWNSVSFNTPQLTISAALLTSPVRSETRFSFKINVTDSSTASEIGKVYECSVEVSMCPIEFLNMTLTDPKTKDVQQTYQFLYKQVIRDNLSDLPQLQLINYKVLCGPSDAYIHLSKLSEKINEPELVLSFIEDKIVLKGYDTHNSTTLKMFLITKIYENPDIDYVDASRSVGQLSNFSSSVVAQNMTDYSVLVSTDRIRALIGVRVTNFNLTEHWARLSYAVLSYSVLNEKQAANFSWTKNNTALDSPSVNNGTASAWPVLNVIQRAVLEAPYKCRGYDYDQSGLYLSNYTAALDSPDLLYDGSCYRPLFTSVIEYDDFGFISNIGNVPLNDLTAQAALANTVPLKSALDVTANSTYIVFESKQHVRSMFAFKVTDMTQNLQLTIDWVPLFFAKEDITAFSPGFSWSAKNRLTAV
jgi:hypothetical protein